MWWDFPEMSYQLPQGQSNGLRGALVVLNNCVVTVLKSTIYILTMISVTAHTLRNISPFLSLF